MSYNLFKRNVQVQFTKRFSGAPSSVTRNIEQLSIPADPFNETLKIDFNVSVGTNSQSATSYIELYNLNDRTQSFIKDLNDEVSLFAGYGDKLSLVFKGNVAKVEITRKNNDMISKIYLGTNIDLITQAHFSKTYAGLIAIKTILTDAVESFKMPFLGFDLIPDIKLFNFTWDGRTKDLFDFILKPVGLNWYNDKGIVNISKVGEADKDSLFVITPSNGLIDYPVKTDNGANINMLFNAQISLKTLIELKLDKATTTLDGRTTNLFIQELNGRYKVISLTHKGSSYDGDMMTVLECGAMK